jgi:hypothetical protein
MTTPGSQAGAQAARSTLAGELRAAADFIEASGMHDRVHVTCRAGHVSISVWEPYEDAAARQAVVTRLAGLIGGAVQRENRPAYPEAGLRADGTIGGLHAEVHTRLTVRRTGPRPGAGRPLAQTPDGQVTVVRGRLPGGWRWVTELDPAPAHASAATGAPALAARDCPPLTSEALRAASRQEQPATARPAQNGTQAAVPRLSRGGS